MRVHVRVPAASGNLGSGFDCAGMALALYNEAILDTDAKGVVIEGEGADFLPKDESNACLKAMMELASRLDSQLPSFGLRLINRIPIGRGLASSGAAALAGLLLANELLGCPKDREQIMELATELEGHPDNVAAALFGGITISAWDGNKVHTVRIDPDPSMKAVLWVPDSQVYTKHARSILPKQVSMQDAVFNLSRAALMAASFARGEYNLLQVATQDRLHQPYRASLVKGLQESMLSALEAGALATWISGAGPSVLALCIDNVQAVELALWDIASKYDDGKVMTLEIDTCGAQVAKMVEEVEV